MTDDRSKQRLQSVVLDEASLASVSRDQEHERQVAIFDLLEANYFEPAGADGGPYALTIALIDNRLALDIVGPDYQHRHLLSLSPFRSLIKDYQMLVDSHMLAVEEGREARLQAIDMGRRGLHNEGAQLLRERLAGKMAIDFATARRLFTLVCVLHHRG